jgi:hypothetical protein
MRNLKAIGIVLGACAALGVSTAQEASAATTSIHPFVCNLVQNGAPYSGISGATYSNGTFTNSSGATAIAMCAVPFQSAASNFWVSTSSTSTNCIMKTMSNTGTASVVFGTHSGKEWSFSTTKSPGSYTAEIECTLANGASLYYLSNY